MSSSHNWRSRLLFEKWEEGRVIRWQPVSYRHRIVVTCYAAGRQRAVFANGEHNFGAHFELVGQDGTWVSQGNNVVPVLPDGRLIMVIEQRPAQAVFEDHPKSIVTGGGVLDLSQFGPFSSVEFPGGGVDAGENFRASFLRELLEETDIKEQSAVLYTRLPPFYPFGSDLGLEMQVCVLYLSDMSFDEYVLSDGGLHVIALSPEEVQRNIWAGNIRSAQAALLGWGFYKEVAQIRQREIPASMRDYISVRTVRLSKR